MSYLIDKVYSRVFDAIKNHEFGSEDFSDVCDKIADELDVHHKVIEFFYDEVVRDLDDEEDFDDEE